MTTRDYRIAYLSGPIDAAQVYDEWRAADEPEYYGTIYLVQLYQILEQLEAKGLVITTLPEERELTSRGDFTIVNLPLPHKQRGMMYHVAMLVWVLRCLAVLLKFRADAALLTAGQDYFWAFTPLRWFGTRLIASLHCTLWPKYADRKVHQRVLAKLNGHLFYPVCDHIQAVSNEAVHQVRQTAVRLRAEPVRFLATYNPDRFSYVEKPSWPPEGRVFRLLYVGRLTRNKGVFDMIDMMSKLQKNRIGRFKLDICGTGPAEAELEVVIGEQGLEEAITMHGQCTTSQLQRLYGGCHAVLVPTRSDFEEGTPKVAFEAVLNFRPLIMSAACPALADVAQATVEPRVDDVDDYVLAIEKLGSNPELYHAMVLGATACRTKHFDERNSYGAKLRPALSMITAGRRRIAASAERHGLPSEPL